MEGPVKQTNKEKDKEKGSVSQKDHLDGHNKSQFNLCLSNSYHQAFKQSLLFPRISK